MTGPTATRVAVAASFDPASPGGIPDLAWAAGGSAARDELDRWPRATANSARRRTASPTAMIRSTRLMPSIRSSLSQVDREGRLTGTESHRAGAGGTDDGPVAASPARRLATVRSVGEKTRGSSITEPTTADEEAGLDRIVTVPNAITLVRLACIPLFLWLLFGAGRQSEAARVVGGPGRDRLGRRFRCATLSAGVHVGKVLDPVADRILVVTAVIAIIVYGAVPLWFGVATLAREVVVSGAVLLLASLGATRIDVLWVGKAGTFALMFSYPAFLLGDGSAEWQDPIRVIAWITGIIGLTLAWIAAGSYVPVARKALAEGSRSRAEEGDS